MRARNGITESMLVLAAWCVVGAFAAAQEEPGPDVPRRAKPPEAKRLPISLDGGASINPDVLAQIKDDTLGLMPEDREAYFRILKLTEKLDPVELRTMADEYREDRHASSPKYRRRLANKFPTFVDLFQHPESYRGRPVTLHGYFRRLVAFDAGKNDQGYTVLYEGWMYADDAQGNPAVVIFTDPPEGMPIGGDISEEISVTGYFLKMYGYQATDTTRKAPLILAHTVRWRPEKEMKRWTPSPQTYLALTAGVAVIGLLIALGIRESQQRQRFEREARVAKYDHFEPIPDADSPVPRSTTPSRNGSSVEPHH